MEPGPWVATHQQVRLDQAQHLQIDSVFVFMVVIDD
jgi:hypothetical protein